MGIFQRINGSTETVVCGRSKIETVKKNLKKVWGLKQSHSRFCFRIWASSIFQVPVSKIRPKICMEAFKWVTS